LAGGSLMDLAEINAKHRIDVTKARPNQKIVHFMEDDKMAKKREQSTAAQLADQLADLEKHKSELTARLQEIQEMRAAAADPDNDTIDFGTLRKLSTEQSEIDDLLVVLKGRIASLAGALREAQKAERAAAVLALRPKELDVIRRFESWLADGVKVLDDCQAMVREIGTAARCVPDPALERLVRYFHNQATAGRSVISRYTDWDGQPRPAAD